MIRRRRSSPLTLWCAALLGMLWLSGCVSTQVEGPVRTTDPAETVALNIRMGTEYMEQGNLPRAHAKLDKALAIDPDNADALQTRALLFQLQGEQPLAEQFFERALSAAPDFTRARNNYAAFLYSQGRIAEACSQLERASQDTDYPNRAQLFTNLGLCQREQGDIEAARASLQRAQAIDPRNARSYFTLAEIHHALGNNERARNQLQTFTRLAGSTPASRRLADQIASASGATTLPARRPTGSENAP